MLLRISPITGRREREESGVTGPEGHESRDAFLLFTHDPLSVALTSAVSGHVSFFSPYFINLLVCVFIFMVA